MPDERPRVRNLVLVLGDQLSTASSAFDGFDRTRDIVWMAEVADESEHVWSHKARIALFLSAMRHFRSALADRGITVSYAEVNDPTTKSSLSDQLAVDIALLKPERLIVTHPGEWRVQESLRSAVAGIGLPLEIRDDRHFLCGMDQFGEYVSGHKQLRMGTFYRWMRREHAVLMDGDGPAGGDWSYDADNRESFGSDGPAKTPEPLRFSPDSITRDVIQLVNERFTTHPGHTDSFDWPVTPGDARRALDDFIVNRLTGFGPWQDAMWVGEPWLYHSRLSAAMNLKLLDPSDVIDAVQSAYRSGGVPVNSAEGFVRQVLGWREYVRGVYWRFMPDYARHNYLGADVPLPDFYWSGDTDMACLAEVISQTLRHGYAHHIQRLMITGLFAQLLGVRPADIHQWYLAIYVDAVEWVEMPNVLGMSQFADGGLMASKPYAATGKYIDRMSNYCDECPYRPQDRHGARACPFTVLYWDFLDRHRGLLAGNPRMRLQLRNLDRLAPPEMQAIRASARKLRGA